MNRAAKTPDDAIRWEAARQALTARGFVVTREHTPDGQTVFYVRRWSRERALHSLDDLAAFTRIAVASEGGPP